MSIIERAADMLGPISQPQRKPSAAGGGVETFKSDLIERAGRDMLGPITQPQRKSSAAGGGGDTFEPDLIERAGGDESQRSDFPVEQILALESEAKDKPALAAGRVSRTLNVDLD